MELLATHRIQRGSRDKYLRFYQGDLSAIPASESVDLLVVSAFPHDYMPTPTSLIGALHRRGISVFDLSQDKQADLRATFSSWLSKDLSTAFPSAGFRRLLCFESSFRASPPETVGDVFRAIMPFALGNPIIQSIAMPILSAGDQGFDSEVMLRAIFDAAAHWLAAGLPIDTVKIVVRNPILAERLCGVFKDLSTREPGPAVTRSASYDLFVSYARTDRDEVDELVNGLRATQSSLRIFLDRLVLNVGQSWQAELDRALECCRGVVAVYSPAYLDSKMCLEEFNMARLRHRESPTPVLRPVYLRTAPLPLYMRTLEYIDCREADRALFSSAARQLASAVGG